MKCVSCGKEFQSLYWNQVCCSKKCKQQRYWHSEGRKETQKRYMATTRYKEVRRNLQYKYALSHKEEIRERYYLKKYGLSLKDVNNILRTQDNKCAICKVELKPNNDPKKPLENFFVLDHNHTTKKNRGILCRKCNRNLGQFNDDIGYLQKAINYLRQYA